jgi:general secretion pathway protein D
MEPRITGPEDVSMHIKVEISNHAGDVPIAGINEPIITQRVNEANIRMRNGEVSLMGGLSDVETSDTNAGVPGITNIPVLSYLFGTKTKTRGDDELLIALIPHILRSSDLSASAQQGVLAGTEGVVYVRRKPESAAAATPTSPNVQPTTVPEGSTPPFTPAQNPPSPPAATPNRSNPGGATHPGVNPNVRPGATPRTAAPQPRTAAPSSPQGTAATPGAQRNPGGQPQYVEPNPPAQNNAAPAPQPEEPPPAVQPDAQQDDEDKEPQSQQQPEEAPATPPQQ